MSANRGAAGAAQDAAAKSSANEPRLLWNPDNVKDVAESVGIAALGDEALRTLSQDVEYRIGQVIIEALRFMRAAKRTTMTVQDVSLALKVLDVEPLYGYESTRPLRYGEASLGPGQPLFYIEDEEVDFEKMINQPLPKVPRDTNFTAHWLAVEGVQPSIPQNPTSNEAQSQTLLAKGPGANPTLGAMAGNENTSFRPAVKHVISKELTLYFEKVQSALLDDGPDAEVQRLREAALESVGSDPGIHQLVPYFVNFISHEVTQNLDDVFVLRQMMELSDALLRNDNLFLNPYASPLCAPVLTCLMGRKLGSDTGPDAVKQQYQLRDLAASLIGKISDKFHTSNRMLRPKIVRSCLRSMLDLNGPPAVWYGAIKGLTAAGGPTNNEPVRQIILPNLKDFENGMLAPLREKGEAGRIDYEAIVGAIIRGIRALAEKDNIGWASAHSGGGNMEDMVNGDTRISDRQVNELKAFVGEIVAERLANLRDQKLVSTVLEARQFMQQ
ncbi:uncharacterized protein B0I36DRAFT_373789 [Microdochium trichocladiopsis]|uniref:TBP-associated factor 6 n=1 Tax=Microdochium trichocladiopsis TaxID=1682393 RepID=A0A9P8YC93_9PEZI|nr:uncharacterized protein B0I36DRAFT_373789 [Microdochium trichocladiopsis]KAH7033659.1 hypothetical protein B0I36DRAFT_373789 [Microdochium trichocladiopsis]